MGKLSGSNGYTAPEVFTDMVYDPRNYIISDISLLKNKNIYFFRKNS
ncbi:MAG: hypothetical protein K2J36_11375 [Ruminococcus sp.]|nr:hypothetical protein [Ruminococcus sp.]